MYSFTTRCSFTTFSSGRQLGRATNYGTLRLHSVPPRSRPWMTPSEARKALQASECSELLDPMNSSCCSSFIPSGQFTALENTAFAASLYQIQKNRRADGPRSAGKRAGGRAQWRTGSASQFVHAHHGAPAANSKLVVGHIIVGQKNVAVWTSTDDDALVVRVQRIATCQPAAACRAPCCTSAAGVCAAVFS